MKDLVDGHLEPMYEIIEKGSLYAYLGKYDYIEGAMSSELEEAFTDVKNRIGTEAESVDSAVTRYYGGLYFSFKQAIDIDAIAAYAFLQDEPLKSKVLAALMGATTDVVNTVGKQFAQPLKVRNADGTLKKNLSKKIKADREIDVFEKFNIWMHYYTERPQNRHAFEVICDDYINAVSYTHLTLPTT